LQTSLPYHDPQFSLLPLHKVDCAVSRYQQDPDAKNIIFSGNISVQSVSIRPTAQHSSTTCIYSILEHILEHPGASWSILKHPIASCSSPNSLHRTRARYAIIFDCRLLSRPLHCTLHSPTQKHKRIAYRNPGGYRFPRRSRTQHWHRNQLKHANTPVPYLLPAYNTDLPTYSTYLTY